MQDIDFDELDRAVNSVSNPTPPSIPESPSVSVPVSQPKPALSSIPAARRSSGRFMDVVHPSSDMRGASVPERSAPRDVPVKPTFEDTFTQTPSPVASSSVATPSKPTSAEWPDPLDFQGFSLEETPVSSTPTPAPTPKVEEPAEETPAQPLESPFLSDAKVEKRPLGAFSTSDEPAETPTLSSEPEETPLLEAPDEVDLLEAESYVPSPSVTQISEPEEEIPTPAPTPIVEEHQGPTSITQQYKEQPSTADQPSGAIYDTEAYHQPLVHAPKKKSGALVIVWIAALILVGAGAGAAVYFFVLPML